MILSSFQAQYGLRLSKEINAMSWGEFCDLLVGIGPETPLGRVVAIRSENDRNVLKNFSKDQHRIRNEWRKRAVKKMSDKEVKDAMERLKQAFIFMSENRK